MILRDDHWTNHPDDADAYERARTEPEPEWPEYDPTDYPIVRRR